MPTPTPKKAGRSKLPHGDFRNGYLRVRITPAEPVEAAVEVNRRSVFESIRGMLIASIEA